MIIRIRFLFILICFSFLAHAQQGTLKGKILAKENGEPIPFATISVSQGGKQFGAGTCDFDGIYQIKPIPPGTYDVIITHLEYHPITMQKVVIPPDQITFLDFNMISNVVKLEVVEIVVYKVPLISKDQTQTGGTITAEEIKKMPSRTGDAVAATVGGVFTNENGEVGGIRGQREEGTVRYVDGVKVIGSASIPQSAIDQVSVITGGLPAQYGNATGGIINITTKGPSRKFGYGAHLQTSQFIDAYGYNLFEYNIQGPLFFKNVYASDSNVRSLSTNYKDNTTSKDSVERSAVIGFFLSGSINYIKDPYPSYNGVKRVNDDKLAFLQENPLNNSGLESGQGMFMNSEFLSSDDLVHQKYRDNANNKGINVAGKIDVKTDKTSNLTFGGSVDRDQNYLYIFENSLLNSSNMPMSNSGAYRGFVRYSKKYPTAADSKKLIRNFYYTAQIDYANSNYEVQDATHKDNLFNYGYVGKFTTHKSKSYEIGDDTTLGLSDVHILNNNFADTLVGFEWKDINPGLANYTKQYYAMYDTASGLYKDLDNIRTNRALVNGELPDKVYNLWYNTGTPYTSYMKRRTDQFSMSLNGSMDIKNHALQFGFQAEKTYNRQYSVSPVGLWTLMRQQTNKHIAQLDKSNPIAIYDSYGVFQDTIKYNQLYSASEQSFFDMNLRKMLGLKVDGLEWIDVDSYDPTANTMNYVDSDNITHTASLNGSLSLDMFNADELLNNGNSYVSYYGYDYAGNISWKDPGFSSFFNDKDEYGNFTRKLNAFQPLYVAGYVQDKFAFNDLIFNIGLRVDRYDANQMVLKDPYLLYNAKTAGETQDQFTHPASVGSDYVVYVDEMNNPSAVTGYRNGSTWYDAKGAEISDPTALETANGIQPYLSDPTNKVINANAFDVYKPQVNILPRIAFSFPISDEALFFAHYDILTRNPSFINILNPIDYYYLGSQSSDIVINNPNLKPEKTIDYELGFQQKVSESSSIKISAYYRELRDLIQIYRFTGAYPKSYISYNNIDFGTVKGLIASYDLRRTGNLWLKTNYTLQFADGTGSSYESAKSLVQSGQPNLRVILPLDYDRRHDLKIVLDYRYGQGKEYNGPRITRKKGETEKSMLLLENTGINFLFSGGSGLPYTSRNIQGDIEGMLNSSRLDWQFRIDARIDRDVALTFGKGEKKRKGNLNIYFQILNLLNTQNIMYVYPATGTPNDDGYLTAPEFQAAIQTQTSENAYRTLYALHTDNPNNYSLPRRVRFGIELSF